MLEAILAQKSTPKEGLIKDNSSKEGKDEGFKDLFTKIITKSTPKEGEKEQKEVSKPALESVGENKNSASENKTLNNLLNSILQASKKDIKAVDKNTTLQSKLTQAKTILESTLNQKIDIKDLKDVKSLKALIIKANEKGLNVKDVKLDILSKKEEKELAQQAKKEGVLQEKAQTEPKQKVTQSVVLSSLLHKKQTLKTDEQPKAQTTLSSLLKDPKANPSQADKGVDLKQILQTNTKPDTSGKVESLLNSVVDKKMQNNDVQKEVLTTKNSLQEQLQTKHQKENILESFLQQKFDVKKNIELKSLQNSFAKSDLNSLLSSAKAQKPEASLSELIQQGSQEIKQEIKTGFMHQTQNLNQKIFDAKETIRGFASNLKEQIQNYKPPVSKIMLTLNPQSLGEVDVVIKSRGDSLSVQISSATAPALQVLAQNSADLRQNLMNMGFDNLSMQFSSNSNGGQGGQQANDGSNSQRTHYQEDELDEELIAQIDQIEINLPKYV